jgi:Tfp pilus assembly protein FimT
MSLTKKTIPRQHHRAAFSLVELVVIVIFLGVLAMITIPRMNWALIKKHETEIQAREIVTDLRKTRQYAISHAAENPSGYRYELQGFFMFFNGYRIVDRRTNRVVDQGSFPNHMIVMANHPYFTFTPLGALQNVSGSQILVLADDRGYQINVNRITGRVSYTRY